MAEQNLPTVQLQEQHQDPEAMATGPDTDPSEPQSTEPKGPVDSPIDEGSLPLIDKGAQIQFPNVLSKIGGATVLSSMGYGKGVPPPAPYLSLNLRLDISKE